MRSDEAFELFWKYVTDMAMSLEVEDPVLPRKRKTPNRLTDVGSMGAETEYFPSTPIELYRQLYFEALDSATSCIVDRMEQPGYKVYSVLEQLLLKSCTGDDIEDCFQAVCSFYKDDFQPDDLRSQLTTFGVNLGPLSRIAAFSHHFSISRNISCHYQRASANSSIKL